jgi:hypothetical protein
VIITRFLKAFNEHSLSNLVPRERKYNWDMSTKKPAKKAAKKAPAKKAAKKAAKKSGTSGTGPRRHK